MGRLKEKRSIRKRVDYVIAILLAVVIMTWGTGQIVSAKNVIKLNKSSITITVGKTYQLNVVSQNVKKVVWSSKQKTIATVSEKGKVTGRKSGTTYITAKVTLKSKQLSTLQCKVIVENKKAVSTPTPTAIPTPTPIVYGETTAFYEPASYSEFAPSLKSKGNNNPILTNSFACDPYAMEYNGRLYVYMTNDSQQFETGKRQEKNSYGYIQSMHIMSTDDMVNWTDHGTFQIAGKTGICKWAGCCWAPCAVHKKVNGKDKFYIYFTNGGYQIGVVAADSPIGPFTDIKGKALIGPDNSDGTQPLDPAAFIDDDGLAYLTYGGDKGARIYKLADDMMSFKGKSVALNAPHMFEDSGFNKIGNKYYYSYCSDWKERSAEYSNLGICSIGYMVSDNVMGPYTFQGDILPNCGTVFGVWGNNHHSMIEFKGSYYMFYHTRVLEANMNIGLGYRNVQVNKVNILADGSIEQVKQDLPGVSQIANFDPYKITSGLVSADCGGMVTIHNNMDGAYMEPITNTSKYKYSWSSISGADFGNETKANFEAAFEGKANSTASMKVCLDSLDAAEIVNARFTFDKDGKASVSVPIERISGKHDIYFEFEGEIRNFKTWQFKK